MAIRLTKQIIHYIIGAFSFFTITPSRIEVEIVSAETHWKNVGSYLHNAIARHESEDTK